MPTGPIQAGLRALSTSFLIVVVVPALVYRALSCINPETNNSFFSLFCCLYPEFYS